MRRHLLLISTMSVLLLFAAASSHAGDGKKDKGDKKEAAVPDYFPLQVGNRWVYKVDANGNVVTLISRIARIEMIDKQPLARLEAEVNGKVAATEHLQQTPMGVLRYRTNDFVPTPPFMLLKSPVKAGDKWAGSFKVGAVETKYASEAQEETVDVPAGKFKTIRVAIRLEENGKTVQMTYWFAQDVGFVKQTVEAEGLNILIQLEKFERKK
jgi:hypothetical protein